MLRWTHPACMHIIAIAQYNKRRIIEKMKSEIKYVEKDWGHEMWFANTPDYCGKELLVRRNKWSSNGRYHYHKIKDETFYVMSGNLILDYVDENNYFHNITLYPGTSFRILPGIKHRFSTITLWGCKFIEASTHHDDEDSYRCHYNKEKGEWIE
jgi:mannose-6-phosphate isomerase